MASITKESDFEKVLKELENPEQIESLQYLASKLPEFTSAVQSMEEKLSFLMYVLNDKQSLEGLANKVEKRVESLSLTTEHMESLLTILQLLPRLTQLLEKSEELILFLRNVLSDSQSIEYAVKGLNNVIPVEKGMDILKETNKRFDLEKDNGNVSILRIYRMLKSPAVQNTFKYLEILLEVIEKKSK